MERVLTPDERIRRAEEKYYRRMHNNYPSTTRVNTAVKPNFNILRKMLFQIIVCVLIYLCVYLMQITNYMFSEEVINRTRAVVSYNMDLGELYTRVRGYIFGDEDEEENQEEEDVVYEEYPDVNPEEYEEVYPQEEVQVEIELGGGVLIDATEDISNLSQMELDARHILANYSVQVPLEGRITSRFGYRNPSNPIVTRFHTGIDIAANTGTVISSAMEGTVTLTSDIRRLPGNI